MTGSEKILESIKTDSENIINGIVSETNDKIKSISDEAHQKADKEVEKIGDEFNRKVAQLRAAAQSRAELAGKNAVLSRKREEINKTKEAVSEYLNNLPEKEYFEILYKLAAKMPSEEGEILLNERDLNRLPSDFSEKMKSVGVNASVCIEPSKINGGFILRCGKVEQSAEFSALVADKCDELEDFINSALFKE